VQAVGICRQVLVAGAMLWQQEGAGEAGQVGICWRQDPGVWCGVSSAQVPCEGAVHPMRWRARGAIQAVQVTRPTAQV